MIKKGEEDVKEDEEEGEKEVLNQVMEDSKQKGIGEEGCEEKKDKFCQGTSK